MLGRRTLVLEVVGPGFFKIMVSCPLISFPVAPVSALRMIVLQDFSNNSCLYNISLGGTKVLSVYFNKIVIFLFVATFGTVSHRHYLHA